MDSFLLLLIVAVVFWGLYYLIYFSLRRMRPGADKAKNRNTAFTVFFLILLAVQLIFLALRLGIDGVRHPGQSLAQQEFFAITAPKLLKINNSMMLIEILFAIFEAAMILFQNRWQHFKRAAILLGLIILAAMTQPAFSSCFEENQRYMCESNLKQIYQSLADYQQTYGLLPDALTERYLPIKVHGDDCYQYHGADKKLTDTPRFLLLEENAANHPGWFQLRLYSDGTVTSQKTSGETRGQ